MFVLHCTEEQDIAETDFARMASGQAPRALTHTYMMLARSGRGLPLPSFV
jgi:hypothetical protein